MSSETEATVFESLPLPDVAQRLDIPVTRVRRLIEDRTLLATRRSGVLAVPSEFLDGGEARHELHGTFILLADLQFSDEEIIDWMFTVEASLGVTPMAALIAGRKAEVRRVAQALL